MPGYKLNTMADDAADEMGRDGTGDEVAMPILRAAAQGESQAFRQLVVLYRDRILRLASRFAADEAELDQLAQDIFIEVQCSLHKYRADAPFSHWLLRIGTRCCHKHLRRRYRARWMLSLDGLLSKGFEPVAGHPGEQREAVELLRTALGHLRPAERTVITLLELEEHSVRETAELTGWSEANVKVRAHRARKALREIIERLERNENKEAEDGQQ